ncbi:MAG: alpha/beta hydrolase-fold protein [Bacteroidia bacterium]|nr:alpha/beta hydrolase-fold protein [Bacteroidia bacterium]
MNRRICIFFFLAFFLSVPLSCSVYRTRVAMNSTMQKAEELPGEYRPDGRLVETFTLCSIPGPTFRRMLVYLPKGYGVSTERYPVFYLNHGARGNETTWVEKGRALQITDSLTACGSARPCILVFTNMNRYKDDEDYGNSRRQSAVESVVETDGRAEYAYMNDVVHHIDSCFRTIPDKEHRAIAGMSMGGLKSMYISARNPYAFAYVGMFSPLHMAHARHGDYSWFFSKLRSLLDTQFADAPLVYDIETGRSDLLYPGIKRYCGYLERSGYEFDFNEYPGGHDWDVWQKAFCNFMEQVFMKMPD